MMGEMKREPIAEYFRVAVFEILGDEPHRGAQVKLAKNSGISASYLNDILKKRTDGSEDVRRAISGALGKSYEDLVNRGREIMGAQEKVETSSISPTSIDSSVDLRWLKTGEGQTIDGGERGKAVRSHIDSKLLEYLIQETENGLARIGQAIDPSKKARLISVLYDYSVETGKQIEAELVDKYLSLII